MHFIYYIENGPRQVKKEDLPTYGLGHIDASKGITSQEVRVGPFNGAGTLVGSAAAPPGLFRYTPDVQQWQIAPAKYCIDGKRWAVCYHRAAGAPGPSELARPRQLAGRLLQMADGREWLIPVAREYSRGNDENPITWSHVLPQVLSLNEDGDFRPGDVQPQYRKLWDLTIAYEQALFDAVNRLADGDQEIRFDFDGTALVCEALRHNYYLSPVEISLLGLLDTATLQSAIDIIRDAEMFTTISRELEEAKRKNDDRPGSETPDSGRGLHHAEPVTDPAMTTAT